MSISVDLAAVLIQCVVMIFFLGKFSEKISNLEKSNNKVIDKLDSLAKEYVSRTDGNRIDVKLDAAWVAIDHIKEQMIPNLHEVILKLLKEHTNTCVGYRQK
jgi:hypothetical protein